MSPPRIQKGGRSFRDAAARELRRFDIFIDIHVSSLVEEHDPRARRVSSFLVGSRRFSKKFLLRVERSAALCAQRTHHAVWKKAKRMQPSSRPVLVLKNFNSGSVSRISNLESRISQCASVHGCLRPACLRAATVRPSPARTHKQRRDDVGKESVARVEIWDNLSRVVASRSGEA
jgi:hypothetical protein